MILSKSSLISGAHHGYQGGVDARLTAWGSLAARPCPVIMASSYGHNRDTERDFDLFIARLTEGQNRGLVVSTEAWLKILDMVDSEQDSIWTLELLITDAKIRGEEWDWKTKGYGQLIGQLIATAGRVGAYEVIDRLIEQGNELRINIKSADFIPSAMRKWSSSNVDLDQLERLFEMEKDLRGINSSSACYELFRAYRRAGNVGKVHDLISRVKQEGLVLKPDVEDEIEKWLEKKSNR
jgi:hypothetical protein